MCELNAYVMRTGKEELLLENVDIIRIEDGQVYLRTLFGEEKVFKGKLREIQGIKRKIILEAP